MRRRVSSASWPRDWHLLSENWARGIFPVTGIVTCLSFTETPTMKTTCSVSNEAKRSVGDERPSPVWVKWQHDSHHNTKSRPRHDADKRQNTIMSSVEQKEISQPNDGWYAITAPHAELLLALADIVPIAGNERVHWLRLSRRVEAKKMTQ